MRTPKPIEVERHARPESFRVAWSTTPRANPIYGTVRPDEKERARAALEAGIRGDGFDPEDCDIVWTMVDTAWGWTAKLKEGALT